MDLNRVRVGWSGAGVVGAAVSTFYWDSTDTVFVGKIGTFFSDLSGGLYGGTSVQIPTSGDVIDSTTGEIKGTWTDPAGHTVSGTNNSGVIDGVGALVHWDTGVIANGRRVRGTTFLVPWATGGFGPDGRLKTDNYDLISGAAATLIGSAAGKLMFFSKKQGAVSITSGTPIYSPAWLRTRKR